MQDFKIPIYIYIYIKIRSGRAGGRRRRQRQSEAGGAGNAAWGSKFTFWGCGGVEGGRLQNLFSNDTFWGQKVPFEMGHPHTNWSTFWRRVKSTLEKVHLYKFAHFLKKSKLYPGERPFCMRVSHFERHLQVSLRFFCLSLCSRDPGFIFFHFLAWIAHCSCVSSVSDVISDVFWYFTRCCSGITPLPCPPPNPEKTCFSGV